MKKIQQGKVYSINSEIHKGHKGEITKKQHNGNICIVVFTHARQTFGKKNIRLNRNLDTSDKQDAYMLPRSYSVKNKHVGKTHENMKMRHPVDKSIKRHLTKKRKG